MKCRNLCPLSQASLSQEKSHQTMCKISDANKIRYIWAALEMGASRKKQKERGSKGVERMGMSTAKLRAQE